MPGAGAAYAQTPRGNVEVNLDVLDHYTPAPRAPAAPPSAQKPAPAPAPTPAPVRSAPYFPDFQDGAIKPAGAALKSLPSKPGATKPEPAEKKAAPKTKGKTKANGKTKAKSKTKTKSAAKSSAAKPAARLAGVTLPLPARKPAQAASPPATKTASAALTPKSPPAATPAPKAPPKIVSAAPAKPKTPAAAEKPKTVAAPARFEDSLAPLNSVDEVLNALENTPAGKAAAKSAKSGIDLPDLDLAMLPPAPGLKQAGVKEVTGQALLTPPSGGVLATEERVTLVYEPGALDLSDAMRESLRKHLQGAQGAEILAYASGGQGTADFLQPINDEGEQADARRISLNRGLVVRDYLLSLGFSPGQIVFKPLGKRAKIPPLDRVDILYTGP